jgi:spheroidene monooxygenase
MNPLRLPAARAPLSHGPEDRGPRRRSDGRDGQGLTLPSAGTVIVLVLVEYASWALPWGWTRMVLRRWPLRHVAGLRFSKILGSGHDGGFGLRPSGTRQGLLLGFDDDAAAMRFVDVSPVMAAYRAHARECCVAVMRVASARGSWSGAVFETTTTLPEDAPIAALTRASIRPRHMLRFWRHAAPSQASLARAPGCWIAAGLGEAPLLRQCTFSVWDDLGSMNAYARRGAHQQAIAASNRGDFFSESMFLRLRLLHWRGTWKGQVYGH